MWRLAVGWRGVGCERVQQLTAFSILVHNSLFACLRLATLTGLTHDTRDLVADPASIEKVVSVPDTAGFVSLGVAGASNSTEPQLPAAPFPLLRHCNGSLSVGGSCGGWPGSALDATFKLVAPLAGCQDGAPAGCASPHARQLLTQPAVAFSDGGLNQEPQLVSFAAASQPCHYLTIDPSSGKLLLRQQLPAGAASQASAAAQTFLLRPQAGMEEGDHMAFTLEPLSQPGTSVRLVEHGQELGVQVRTLPHVGYARTDRLQGCAAALFDCALSAPVTARRVLPPMPPSSTWCLPPRPATLPARACCTAATGTTCWCRLGRCVRYSAAWGGATRAAALRRVITRPRHRVTPSLHCLPPPSLVFR